MNKQFVIAALLSSTYAADCKDAYTNLADAELAAAKEAKIGAEGRQKKAEELRDAEVKNVESMKGKQDPIDAIVKPFTTHWGTAKAAASAALEAYNTAVAAYGKIQEIDLGDTTKIGLWKDASVKMQFSAKQTDLTDLEKAKNTTKDAKEKAEGELVTLKGNADKYDAELARRKAQKELYQSATTLASEDKAKLETATKVETQWGNAKALTKTQLDTAQKITDLIAGDYKNLKQSDLEAVKAWRDAEAEATAKKDLATPIKETMDNAYNDVETKKALEKEKWTQDNIYDKDTVCNTNAADCVKGDLAFDDRDANKTTIADLTAKLTTYGEKRDLYMTAYNTEVEFNQKRDVKELDMLALENAAKQAKTDADTDAAKDVKSAGYLAEATKGVENSELDVKNTAAAIVMKNAEIQRLTNNETIAGHIYDLAKDKFDNLQATRDGAKDLKDQTVKQEAIAKTANDRAQAKLKVYKDQYDGAVAMKDAADVDVGLYKGQVAAAAGKVDACTAKQAAALANCKGVKYKMAQDTYKKWDEQRTKNKEIAATVASEYDTESKAPTDGTAGTRCEFPAKGADGTQEPRPKCADELCCGSANKYLRDGTRLTVETCQALKGTHSYKFFPKLKEGALVKPSAENWRFYCIEGAQKLAATLAAGLGAAYFMA